MGGLEIDFRLAAAGDAEQQDRLGPGRIRHCDQDMIEHCPLFRIEDERLRGNKFFHGVGIALFLAISYDNERIGGRKFFEQALDG